MYLVLLGFERPMVAMPLYRADPSERPLSGQGLACYRARPQVTEWLDCGRFHR